MAEAAGWTGIIMAIAAMIRGEVAGYTARKVAREKAESDRLAARDKMEFDAELLALKAQNAAQEKQINTLTQGQKDCQEESARLKQEAIARDARDKADLQKQIDALKNATGT